MKFHELLMKTVGTNAEQKTAPTFHNSQKHLSTKKQQRKFISKWIKLNEAKCVFEFQILKTGDTKQAHIEMYGCYSRICSMCLSLSSTKAATRL